MSEEVFLKTLKGFDSDTDIRWLRENGYIVDHAIERFSRLKAIRHFVLDGYQVNPGDRIIKKRSGEVRIDPEYWRGAGHE